MLEIKYVRKNLSLVQESLKNRGGKVDLDSFTEIETGRREILSILEKLQNRRNVVSEQIARMKKNGENADDLVLEMREVSTTVKDLEKQLTESDEAVNRILYNLPNIPHSSVPIGKDENDNPELRKVGAPPVFDFEPKAHWDIGEDLHILDLERATKITGARFPLYLGKGARLERSLINFMLDTHTEQHGYKEIIPPYIVSRNSMTCTGQLPKFEEDLFKIEGMDYFLIPTAEVPVTNIHQKEILEEEDLPVKFVACTPCFRSEAGSYGKDTRGLIRQHQFNKVELVKLAHPDTSYDELEKLTNDAETILKKLGLAYRVITLCTGDMGFSAAKTYDLEVWMPGQGKYREISSCSNFEDFQARRAGIRFKRKGQKGTELVHTLNGSGLAVGRCFAAILENYQQKDGSVLVPDVLVPYMGGVQRITL
ncbi:MAG: serine--tRNA ligase [Desulfobacteraceae bacterium]